MTYQPARGLRGDFNPRRGDLTGSRYLSKLEEKEEREKAIEATLNELRDGTPLVLVPIPGGGSRAVSRAVYERLLEIGAQ
jgi:hypothetical protein